MPYADKQLQPNPRKEAMAEYWTNYTILKTFDFFCISFNCGIRLRLHSQGQEIFRVSFRVVGDVVPITLSGKHLMKNKNNTKENRKQVKENTEN